MVMMMIDDDDADDDNDGMMMIMKALGLWYRPTCMQRRKSAADSSSHLVAVAVVAVRAVHCAPNVERYIVAVCRATRSHPEVELGAAPRASLALLRACRAWAALERREYVVPDDVRIPDTQFGRYGYFPRGAVRNHPPNLTPFHATGLTITPWPRVWLLSGSAHRTG